MIVAFPLTVQIDYTELKYSLRSLEKFLKPPFEVVIVSDHVPEWLNHITQIWLPDVKGRKQLSIKKKILAALEYEKEILFFNDDIYLLKPMNEFPYYYNGTLKNYSESGSKPLMKELEQMGKPIKHFDGHFGLIYEKEKFKEAISNFNEDTIIKSAYCNYWKIEGVQMPDCKLLKQTKPEQVREFIKDRHCFSTGTYSLKAALPILQELFPNPSNFEL